MVNTDRWRGYDGLVDVGVDRHFRVRHGQDEFVGRASHTNGIESFWRFAKVSLQQFKGLPKHTFLLHLKESEFHFSHRCEDLCNCFLSYFVNNHFDRVCFLSPYVESAYEKVRSAMFLRRNPYLCHAIPRAELRLHWGKRAYAYLYFLIKTIFMKSGIIHYSLSSIRFYLTNQQKRKTLWLFLLTLISSFMEVLGLASLVPVMMVAAEPGGVQKSKYFGPVYQLMGFQSEPRFLLFMIVVVFLFFLIKNMFSAWVSYIQVRFTAEIGISIIKTQLNKYLNLPFWYFNDYGSASLINSTLAVPTAYVNGIIRALLVFFSEMAVVTIIVISILLYKPLLIGLLALVLLPTATLSYRVLRTRSQKIGNRINELRPVSYAIIGDLFTGFAELKLANKQQRFQKRLIENQTEVQNLDAEAYIYGLLPTKMIEMVAIIGVLTIFLYAIFFPSASINLIALVGLFAAAAYRLMPSVNRILTSLVQLKQFQYTIENLEAYRDAKYDEAPHPQQLPLVFNRSITFDNLYFSFPGEHQPTLRGINIKIQKGEKIGFIGSSGSGKTTLMNVLLRFYTEQKGSILIDGEPLTPQHLHAWHNIIGYVKQDTFLMEASIQDNITLGDPQVDPERMRYAIEQASLQAFVASLPDGVNTLVGERGSKLSGGQRQRIGIARALYKQTEVVVLDEATSALDNETEREVNEAINKLSHTDITILIIAHRITTLRECDRIYELKNGEVIAEHQYADLMRKIVQVN